MSQVQRASGKKHAAPTGLHVAPREPKEAGQLGPRAVLQGDAGACRSCQPPPLQVATVSQATSGLVPYSHARWSVHEEPLEGADAGHAPEVAPPSGELVWVEPPHPTAIASKIQALMRREYPAPMHAPGTIVCMGRKRMQDPEAWDPATSELRENDGAGPR